MVAATVNATPPLPGYFERPPEEDRDGALIAAERAEAHARMPDTMYASTPSESKAYFGHPVPASPGVAERDHWPRLPASAPGAAASGGESARDVFRERISGPVVQAKCVHCHVANGVSGHTRLVFAPASADDHEARNYRAFEDMLVVATDGAALILDKINGARGHGGGVQVASGTAQYADMRRFLQLLAASRASPVTAQTLFDTVTARDGRRTLYQAALILAGRIPTDAEYASLGVQPKGKGEHGDSDDSEGDQTRLRAAVRALMAGPGFHEFLIRAANDRLHTDGFGASVSNHFVGSVNEYHRLSSAYKKGNGSALAISNFVGGYRYGTRRAPLELIAHVVEKDLPYPDVLTADYVMANPPAAVVYGFKPTFEDTDDIHDFQPARILGHHPNFHSFVWEKDDFGRRIVDPGPASDYPHAGVLNTLAFLYRYPTSPTNRNRARARWAYYHFLGVDVERLGRIAIDVDAIADEDNPTMNNSACTGCHAILDPVAGTFQRYEESGEYEPGNYWFADMREPGFNGEAAPEASNGLEWLGRKIAEDERFAEATVKFWWPAIMGRDVALPPTDLGGADFQGALLAAAFQNAEVQRLARMFRDSIRGGKPYNLKDLLTELVVSKWFMAEHVTDADPVRRSALRTAGAARPLTPEELVAKTEALTGYVWGRYRRWSGPERDRPIGTIVRNFRVLYGGIDSRNTTHRRRAFTVPMTLMAKKHAMVASISAVARDFFLVPPRERRLFAGIELDETPETAPKAVKEKLVELHGKLFGQHTNTGSKDVLDAYRFLVDVWRQQGNPPYGNRPGIRGWYSGGQHDHRYLEGILDEALNDGDNYSWFDWDVGLLHDYLHDITTTEEEMRMLEAWGMMLAAMFMDYRYLHL